MSEHEFSTSPSKFPTASCTRMYISLCAFIGVDSSMRIGFHTHVDSSHSQLVHINIRCALRNRSKAKKLWPTHTGYTRNQNSIIAESQSLIPLAILVLLLLPPPPHPLLRLTPLEDCHPGRSFLGSSRHPQPHKPPAALETLVGIYIHV